MQQQVKRHPAQRPFAQAAVAIRTRHDQLGPKFSREMLELHGGIAAIGRRGQRLGLNIVCPQPGRDLGQPSRLTSLRMDITTCLGGVERIKPAPRLPLCLCDMARIAVV